VTKRNPGAALSTISMDPAMGNQRYACELATVMDIRTDVDVEEFRGFRSRDEVVRSGLCEFLKLSEEDHHRTFRLTTSSTPYSPAL